jgi:hypothetical protein
MVGFAGPGGAGDDRIDVWTDGIVDAGDGDDVVRAWSNGLVSGGAGNDRLSGWSNSLVDGGDGADLISVWAGSTARGGAGDDAIYTSVDANVTGGTGDDLISVGGNSVVNFDAGDGKDTVYANRPTVLNFGEGITADKTHVTMSDRHTATITFDGSDDQIALNLGWSGSGHAGIRGRHFDAGRNPDRENIPRRPRARTGKDIGCPSPARSRSRGRSAGRCCRRQRSAAAHGLAEDLEDHRGRPAEHQHAVHRSNRAKQQPLLGRRDVAIAERRVVHESEIHEVVADRCSVKDHVGPRPETMTSQACAAIRMVTAAIMTAVSRAWGCAVCLVLMVCTALMTTVMTAAWIAMLRTLTPAPTRI